MDPAFFASVRASLFGGALTQPQADALTAIGTAWDKWGDGDPDKLAYVLATAFHETGRFKWLKEIWGPTAAQKRYEGRADLGNTVKGDGKRFMGRGFCQITGRRNYADWSKRLGVDLLAHPEMAEQLDIAARILVQGTMLGTFTGKKLADYIDSNTLLLSMPPKPKVDFVNARRTVNGTDKADLIAGYAQRFRKAITSPVGPTEAAKPIPAPTPAPNKPKSPVAAILAVLAALGAAAYAFLRTKGIVP